MSRVFFGKFVHENLDQLENKYYAAGAEGNTWYGGISPGDYVFVISRGALVLALWKVKQYENRQNPINPTNPNVVTFEEVRKLEPPIALNEFIKSPYFDVDINLLNKITKQTNSGFYEIKLTSLFPNERFDQLSFDSVRKFYVTLSSVTPPLSDHDVIVVIDDLENTKITGFQVWVNGHTAPYQPLSKLYEEKNPISERFTLLELLEYAKQEAVQKKNYLESVLSELKRKGYFVVENARALYDNILVGRKKSGPSQPKNSGNLSNANTDTGGTSDEVKDDGPEFDSVYMKYAELLDFNPNLILYGPPGTGKTYATKNIIEAFEYKHHAKYVPYSQVEQEERVRFITFHQSYSYEDFIEGIRPELIEDDPDAEGKERSGELRYRVAPGVLMEMQQAATTAVMKEDSKISGIQGADLIRSTSSVWKVALGERKDDTEYKRSKQDKVIAVDFLSEHNLTGKKHDEIYQLLVKSRIDSDIKPINNANSLDCLINRMEKGDIVFIYDGRETIRDVGVIIGDYEYRNNRAFPHVRPVIWLKEYAKPQNIFEMNGGNYLLMKSIYKLNRIRMADVQRLIGGVDVNVGTVAAVTDKALKANPKPYYLIIDEINRGNISRIFGELMTLLEKDKRSTYHTVLPYSKKPFTLPPNLYFIGTMNTADRSVAMLDTALRRRFAFVELEPNYEVFAEHTAKVGTVDLAALLYSINERIANRLDRDHRIGHAYFMDVLTVDALHKTWYYKVLPLISEYFYNDVASIQAMVGKEFIASSGSILPLDTQSAIGAASPFELALQKIYKDTIS